MAAPRDADPGRIIALKALGDEEAGDMLEDAILYAFNQLCWRRTTPQLVEFLAQVQRLMTEDA